jgi:hypothetical protein
LAFYRGYSQQKQGLEGLRRKLIVGSFRGMVKGLGGSQLVVLALKMQRSAGLILAVGMRCVNAVKIEGRNSASGLIRAWELTIHFVLNYQIVIGR